MASQRDPAFPIEIFGCIIDELALLHTTEDDLKAVKTCSLVCKALVPLCRAHIFREVTMATRLFIPPFVDFKLRMIRFLSILANNFSIANYIRVLTLHCELYTPVDAQIETLEVLLRLPNIHVLNIQSWGVGGSSRLREFRRRLIDVNVSNKNLRSLQLGNIQDLAFDRIFACTSLKTLCLSRCNLQALANPRNPVRFPSHIEHLKITKCTALPLSVIFQAHNLEKLVLKSRHDSILLDKRDVLLPKKSHSSFGLKTLTLKSTGEIDMLIDTSIERAEGGVTLGCKPFDSMLNLTVVMIDTTCTATLKGILPYLFSLRTLQLTTSYRPNSSVPFLFPELEMHKYCPNTFNLTELSLRFDRWTHQETYLTLVDYLARFFDAISSTNSKLEHLRLTIGAEWSFESRRAFIGVTAPFCGWSNIVETLEERSKFPKLKHVEIQLQVKVTEGHDINTDTIEAYLGHELYVCSLAGTESEVELEIKVLPS